MSGRPRLHADDQAARSAQNKAAAERARFAGRRTRTVTLHTDVWTALRSLRSGDETSDSITLERLIVDRAR